jgi:cell division protein FtsL
MIKYINIIKKGYSIYSQTPVNKTKISKYIKYFLVLVLVLAILLIISVVVILMWIFEGLQNVLTQTDVIQNQAIQIPAIPENINTNSITQEINKYIEIGKSYLNMLQ